MARLTIIIVTYNSASDIERCLQSLSEAPPLIEHEIVIVDNASTDTTVSIVTHRFPHTRLLQAQDNIGFAAANNLAIRQTEGELLLLLNPDTLVRPGAIDVLVQTLDARADAAACGPRLVDAEGRAELSFGASLGPLSELRQKFLVRGHEARWPVVGGLVEWLTRRPGEPDWVSGACLLVRREDAEVVGLLDERYFLYIEDVDFCAALREQGRAVLFEPAAEVAHLRGRSRRSAASQSERAYRSGQLAFYLKHHPALAPLLAAYLRLRGRYPT
jgi:GT2 family glycosyltransferase